MRTNLPEKWCIRWESKEKYKIIQDYLNKINHNRWEYNEENIHSKAIVDCNNNYHGAFNYIPYNFELITFEEFKYFILENNNAIYEIY